MSLLNTPIRVGKTELKNRLVMPPMATHRADPDGYVTDEILEYYEEKSRGGYIGLIIVEHSFVSQDGKASKGQLSVSRNEDIEGLAHLAEIIHKNGSKTFMQINHAGSATDSNITGQPVLAPSTVPNPRIADSMPLSMTKADIARITTAFAAAAMRSRAAGFDGVEIHSAHGYLLNQFYSPLTNKRTDEYGPDSISSRLRLHKEIIAAIRSAAGDDYPIALRLGACDYMEGGSTLKDSAAAGFILEQSGIDLIDVSGGFCGYISPDVKAPGYFAELSEAIRQNVSIPVVLTGGIREARTAETLLCDKKADLIGVGRSILRDSSWAERTIASLS